MAQLVTYRGTREDLKGQSFEVPAHVVREASAGKANIAKWIETKDDDDAEIQRAEEAATKQREQALVARMEEQRTRTAALAEEQRVVEGQAARDDEFRVELTDLSQAVMTSGAAVVGKAEAIEAKHQEWESRGEAVISGMEAAKASAEERVQFAEAVVQTA